MKCVQYGCGPFSNPEDWDNFDTSPTLRLQNVPILGSLSKKIAPVIFKKGIQYGDIVKGLMGQNEASCDAVFCSHVLEHLTLKDFKIALINSYKLLKPGGIFRCIVPDLETYCRKYLEKLSINESDANHYLLERLMLHNIDSNGSLKQLAINLWGNAGHKYMWDRLSLEKELVEVGFSSVRRCDFNDSSLDAFKSVEIPARFESAIAFECIK